MSQHRLDRLATVVAAPVAALAVWVLTQLLGVDLELSGSGHQTVGPVDVGVAAFAGALAAWAFVLVIERRSRRARLVWARVGSTALAISMIGPSWFADGASAVALICMHVVTAVVVLTGFMRTLPAVHVSCAEHRILGCGEKQGYRHGANGAA